MTILVTGARGHVGRSGRPHDVAGRFTDPDELDVARAEAAAHVAFGYGIHSLLINTVTELPVLPVVLR